jgi:hypothetical protein
MRAGMPPRRRGEEEPGTAATLSRKRDGREMGKMSEINSFLKLHIG